MIADMKIFNDAVNTARTEVEQQQLNLFNAASGGAINLQAGPIRGDYMDTAFWKKVATVRRRNAKGTSAISSSKLEQVLDTMVKVAAGTPKFEFSASQFTWLQKNPEEHGAVLGQQLALDSIKDKLDLAITALVAALSQVTAVNHDATDGVPAFSDLLTGAQKFGDASSRIGLWVLHSKSMTDLWTEALTNSTQLFNYDTITVSRDPFGRIFLVTDSPSLVEADGVSGGVDKYFQLGLTPGAANIYENLDFNAEMVPVVGKENIEYNYQAEWTYNLGLKGFAWDKGNGGSSPNDAAIGTAANWDKNVTSNKDLAGVLVSSR